MTFWEKWFPKVRDKITTVVPNIKLRSYKNGDTVTKFEHEKFLAAGYCPDCESGIMYQGPSGGMSTNVACETCGSEFNLTMLPGMTERISTRGQPRIQRLQDVYHITLGQNI